MTKRKDDGHPHMYKRGWLGRPKKSSQIYKCIEPGCTHYLRMNMALNALCKCNRCGEMMILTKKAMTLAYPHCDDCTVRKPSHDKLKGILEEMGI